MEAVEYLRYLLALLFVLALIGGLTLILRRFGLERHLSASRGDKRRLEVIEVLPLGPRHRMVLVRRDQQEHLLVLGQDGTTTVVEKSGSLES